MVLNPERVLLEKRSRVEQIVRVLSRDGLLYDALDAGPEWLSAIRLPKPDPAVASLPLAQRLAQAATELGPTFIKIGQILGTRPDVVGPQAAAALSGLEADVSPEPFPVIRKQVENELGRPLDEAYAEFDPIPVGAASVGQVHAARLPDGSPVVVKVLRPGIEEVIADDLAILGALAAIVSRRATIGRYDPVRVMGELAHALTQELDLNREATNLRKFIKNFAGQPNVVFPHPIDGLCTQRVLTETRVPGLPLSRSMKNLTEQEKRSFVSIGLGVYLDMVFRDNLFHGDPHAGNLFFSDGTLGIIDFGEVGRLDPDVLNLFEVIILSVVEGNNERLIDALLELVSAPPNLDRSSFRRDVNDWVDDYVSVGNQGTDMSGAISAVMALLREYNLTLPPDLALLIKALLQLQGILVATGLKVQLFDYILPYSRKIMIQRFSVKRMARTASGTARGWSRLLQHTPADVEDIISSVRRGELQLPMDLKGIDRPVNRLVAGLVVAALIRGSTDLWARKAEPSAAGISLPGALGTVVSTAAALRLLRALSKSGGL